MAEDYLVQQGDCISSVAYEEGFFWQTIWNDSGNAQLKAERKDPNILMEGDIVHIPDLQKKEIAAATDKRHTYIRKGIPAKLRMQLLEEQVTQSTGASASSAASSDMSVFQDPAHDQGQRSDRPRANVPYTLSIDGRSIQGTTDGEGRIDVPLPPNARQGCLIIEPGTPRESVLQLTLGAMDPITEIIGVRKRLNNLGFPCGEANELTPEVESALRCFQEKHGLQVTGQPDQPTRDKLQQLHGS